MKRGQRTVTGPLGPVQRKKKMLKTKKNIRDVPERGPAELDIRYIFANDESLANWPGWEAKYPSRTEVGSALEILIRRGQEPADVVLDPVLEDRSVTRRMYQSKNNFAPSCLGAKFIHN
ncbi:hypothetical protein NX059_005680 [Plenodomus lindquistii]|nr:hypothetical protein NX059_005680 [Plenodomus lindquistii]